MTTARKHLDAAWETLFEYEVALVGLVTAVKHTNTSIEYRADVLAHAGRRCPEIRDHIASLIEDTPDLADAFAAKLAEVTA